MQEKQERNKTKFEENVGIVIVQKKKNHVTLQHDNENS